MAAADSLNSTVSGSSWLEGSGGTAKITVSTGSTTKASTLDSGALKSSVSSILGLNADVEAADAKATGYDAEALAYGNVSSIAEQNALIEGVSGEIQGLQLERKLAGTIGEQQAQVAAVGFRSSGSSLDILKSSLQQGYLDQQILQTQTALSIGAYLEESAAAKGQKTAAEAASTAAKSLSSTSATSATSETEALDKYLKGKTLTDAEKLILSPLGGKYTSTGTDTTDLTTSTTTKTKSIFSTPSKPGAFGTAKSAGSINTVGSTVSV